MKIAYDVVGGGLGNQFADPATNGFIGGGLNNCIMTDLSVVAGGSNNSIFGGTNAFIGGGDMNQVNNDFGAVLGGDNNTVSGDHSVILGGTGNNDNGFAYAGIYGNGVNAVMSNAFHANNFVAQSIPPGNFATCAPPTGAATGSLYYIIPTGSSFCQVWIA